MLVLQEFKEGLYSYRCVKGDLQSAGVAYYNQIYWVTWPNPVLHGNRKSTGRRCRNYPLDNKCASGYWRSNNLLQLFVDIWNNCGWCWFCFVCVWSSFHKIENQNFTKDKKIIFIPVITLHTPVSCFLSISLIVPEPGILQNGITLPFRAIFFGKFYKNH